MDRRTKTAIEEMGNGEWGQGTHPATPDPSPIINTLQSSLIFIVLSMAAKNRGPTGTSYEVRASISGSERVKRERKRVTMAWRVAIDCLHELKDDAVCQFSGSGKTRDRGEG